MSTVKNNDSLRDFVCQYNVWKSKKIFYDNSNIVNLENFLNLPCYHYTDIKNINKSCNDTIVIDNITESIHSYGYFSMYDSAKHYIIFTGGMWDKEKCDIGIRSYDIIHCWTFLYQMIESYQTPYKFCFYLDKNYDFNYPKRNLFFSTIGNKSLERDVLVQKIITNLDMKNCILRYSGDNLANPSDHLDVIKFERGNFDPYTEILPEHYHNVSQSLPIKIYNECYFSLVVETDLDYQNSFFITEKTMKAILTGIPFIVLSTPYFLEMLRSVGFKTFNTLWDESYDSEPNFGKRTDKIISLITSLSDFDWFKHRFELENIANHNIKNMMKLNKLSDIIYKSFENIVEDYNDSRC